MLLPSLPVKRIQHASRVIPQKRTILHVQQRYFKSSRYVFRASLNSNAGIAPFVTSLLDLYINEVLYFFSKKESVKKNGGQGTV